MAAKSLEEHAKKRGITLKAETNGTGGRKNVLTDEEIANAKCIIVAADKNVPMARFNGKHVIITKVADGINKADELLDRALAQDAPIFQSKGNDEDTSSSGANESLGRQLYKHLMNGVSHMLPFVVGGGILIAIAFLVDGLRPGKSRQLRFQHTARCLLQERRRRILRLHAARTRRLHRHEYR